MLIKLILLLTFLNYLLAICPNGSISYSRNPTKCYYFKAEKQNWMVADQQCGLLGGYLVSIHDMLENMFISGEASTLLTGSTDADFWIGANDMLSPNKWSWTDNTSFDFFDWDKTQPPNSPGPLCVSSMMNGARWSAVDCFNPKPYVCEVKAKMCPERWTYFEETDSCYKIIQQNATWSESEQSCKNENAHSVSLHSYTEALFVTNLANSFTQHYNNACNDDYQMWIGLSTPDNNTSWEWTDGTKFDYQNWGSLQPDGPGLQSCVIMWFTQPCSYGWDDAPTEWDNTGCGEKVMNTVCKKAKS